MSMYSDLCGLRIALLIAHNKIDWRTIHVFPGNRTKLQCQSITLVWLLQLQDCTFFILLPNSLVTSFLHPSTRAFTPYLPAQDIRKTAAITPCSKFQVDWTYIARIYTVCIQTSPRYFPKDIRMLNYYTFQIKRLLVTWKNLYTRRFGLVAMIKQTYLDI
jgi:hypothetical protein